MISDFTLDALDRLGALVAVMLIAFGIITRKLIWHRDHADLVEDRNYWRGLALGLLGVTEKQAESGEVTAKVLSALPTPDSQEQS